MENSEVLLARVPRLLLTIKSVVSLHLCGGLREISALTKEVVYLRVNFGKPVSFFRRNRPETTTFQAEPATQSSTSAKTQHAIHNEQFWRNRGRLH